MQRIDAHQHFWKFDPVKDSWIPDEMAIIRRDFLPSEFEMVMKQNGFDGSVVVQADQSENENIFLLINAEENDFIKGVVGWVDLRAPSLMERLKYYSQFKKLKGFRHILQGALKRDLMLTPDFIKGVNDLKKFNYTYDILIMPDQLVFTKEFVAKCPGQKFVIDHLAKPYVKDIKIEPWKTDIRQLAQHENVFCKISGFITEADRTDWKKEDFYPYFDVVVESFGINRIMFGSDWPVCIARTEYSNVLSILEEYFAPFTKNERDRFFGGNAIEFYNL